MKNLTTLIALMFACACFGQTLQFNRFATTPDGNLINGNTVTNVQGSNVVGSLSSPAVLGNLTNVSAALVYGNGVNPIFTSPNGGGGSNFMFVAPSGSELADQFGNLYFLDGSKFADSSDNIYGNAQNVTHVPAAQVTGTLPLATLPGSGTNQATTLYNDTNALAYLNAAGVSDGNARNDLTIAVNALKRRGVWKYVYDMGLTQSRFGSTNHLTLFGNTEIFSNEQYNSFGFAAQATNFITLNNIALTNFSLFIIYRANGSNIDRLDFNHVGEGSGPSCLAAIYNTNKSYQGVAISPFIVNNTADKVWSTPGGTNWNNDLILGVGTNTAYTMYNGQFDKLRCNSFLPVISGVSYRTNGLTSRWINGNPAPFLGGISTNVLLLDPNASGFNQMMIASGGSNFIQTPVAFQIATNAVCDIAGWILFNDAVEDASNSLPLAAQECGTDILDYDNAVDFQGSSIVDLASPPQTSSGTPITNTLSYIYQSLHPRTLVLDEANGGSYMGQWPSMNNAMGGAFSFSNTELTVLSPEKYKSKKIFTDALRNDNFGGGQSFANQLANWNKFYAPYNSSNVEIYLICDGWDYSQTLQANLNWIQAEQMVITNSLVKIAGIVPLQNYQSSNYMAGISASSPPVHPNALNQAAQQFDLGFAQLCDGRPWPVPNWPQNMQIAASMLPVDGYSNFISQFEYQIVDASGKTFFTRDGSGFTNIPPSALNGTLPLATLPGAVVTNTMSPNGTNDCGALASSYGAISNCFVNWSAGDYYTTNITVTAPNVTFNANGNVVIHQLFSGAQFFWRTNAQWFMYTNFCFLINAGVNQTVPNFRMRGFILDGSQPKDYDASSSFSLYISAGMGMYPLQASLTGNGATGSYAITNNFGLGWNALVGGSISDCTAENFGGCGFLITGDGQSSYNTCFGNFYGNRAASNFCGIYFNNLCPGQQNAVQTNFGNAEYVVASGLSASSCAFGIFAGASNLQLDNSSANHNYIGFEIQGGSDDNTGPHTRYSHIKSNHCVCGLYIDSGIAIPDYVAIDNYYSAATTTNIIKRANTTFFGSDIGTLGIYADSTNQTTTFLGCNLYGITGYVNNTILMQGNRVNNLCQFTGCTVNDFNNFTTIPFSVWTNSVVTWSGGAYYGSGMGPDPATGLPDYFGTFTGNGANITNIPPSALNGNATPHVPTAVSLGASPYTFTNFTSSTLECYFSGSVAYSISKNGVGVFGSLASDGYFVLQPTNNIVITYTVAPTFYTNAW